jgi:phenylalanyl-tRNA synthetase beta chain
VYPGRREPEPISLSTDETKRILGVEFSLDQIVNTLTSLGFDGKADGTQVRATAPYWRSDIKRSVDLIEEVARIIGYDQIPTTMLGDPLPRQNPEPILSLKDKIRQNLAGCGFQEVITYSLTGMEMLSNLTPESSPPEPVPMRVANPMTADQEYLRPNLRANLLAVLSANRRHEERGIRLFELGKIYLPREKDLPAEPEVLCGLMSGNRIENSWLGGDGLFDFYDAKGVVEGLFSHLGVAINFEKGNDKGLHPARQASIVIQDNGVSVKLGTVGELHPKVADNFEIAAPVCLFEINVSILSPFTTVDKMFQPIPRFPSTIRDLALVVDSGVTHQRVQDIIQDFPLVSEVILFDVYSGKQVAAGKKSLAYRVVYQSPTHTLTDEEVNKVQRQILDRLTKELGATLRA